MKKSIIAVPVFLLAAAPAYGTGGLMCRTAGNHPVEVAVVISHTVVSAAVSARLTDDSRDIPVRIAQSWLERAEIRLDLVDPHAQRHELRLRAKLIGPTYDGSIWRNSKRRWVRCRES